MRGLGRYAARLAKPLSRPDGLQIRLLTRFWTARWASSAVLKGRGLGDDRVVVEDRAFGHPDQLRVVDLARVDEGGLAVHFASVTKHVYFGEILAHLAVSMCLEVLINIGINERNKRTSERKSNALFICGTLR